MNFWEYLGNRHQQLLTDAYQHAGVVFQCMVVATVIGVLIGAVTHRSVWAGNLATTTTSSILNSADRGFARFPGLRRQHPLEDYA